MSGRKDAREERARLRATRVEVIADDGTVRLVATQVARHGVRRTYDVYGCDCEPCRAARCARARKYRADKRAAAGKPVYDTTERARVARASRRRAPVPVLRVCELDGCAELIPLDEGFTPSMYAKVRYHSAECRNLGRAAKLSAVRAPVLPACECGCGELVARPINRFASRSCVIASRAYAPRVTKVCQCGCLTEFERPQHMSDKEWEKRRFIDAEHRKRAPGESRAGARKEPKPMPSRDRRQSKDQPKPRPVFDGPAPATPWRPPPPVIERVERTARRPSFGLTRRSA